MPKFDIMKTWMRYVDKSNSFNGISPKKKSNCLEMV